MKTDYKPTETHKGIYKRIKFLRKSGLSYESIGKILLPDYNNEAAKLIVWRFYVKHQHPKDNGIRMSLGLPRIKHVQEHMVRKNKPAAKPDKRHRRAINLDDPESAALTIINSQATDEYITRLAHLLTGIERKV